MAVFKYQYAVLLSYEYVLCNHFLQALKVHLLDFILQVFKIRQLDNIKKGKI